MDIDQESTACPAGFLALPGRGVRTLTLLAIGPGSARAVITPLMSGAMPPVADVRPREDEDRTGGRSPRICAG